jgi:hypothetical protein
MYLRRCLSIGMAAMSLACGIGVSGLESVSLTSTQHGGSPEPSILDAAVAEGDGAVFDGAAVLDDNAVDSGVPAPHGRGATSVDVDGGDAGKAADGSLSLDDAEVVDVETVGCPDRAVCPATQVCCAVLLGDGGAIGIALDDAGALQTSCAPSCTAGTSPLCASDSDCVQSGVCFKEPATSARGFCTAGFFPAP